jgi:uncharacterized coiled-coil protein SlyX
MLLNELQRQEGRIAEVTEQLNREKAHSAGQQEQIRALAQRLAALESLIQ